MTTIREALLARAADDHPALFFEDQAWSWRSFVEESSRRAGAVTSLLGPDRPPHVGLLMDNTPEMMFALGAAGLGTHVVVGLNVTRRGTALAADVRKADCQVVLADPRLVPLLDGLDLGGAAVLDVSAPDWTNRVGEASATPPVAAPEPSTLFMLVFTSGTSGEPKAVRVIHEKVTAPSTYVSDRLGLTRTDVHYVAMPLFHSNAMLAGWGPALMKGATVALREKFSASVFFDDVRRYGATYANYVGKPLAYILATPERPDDAENPLRLVFGNEAGDKDTAAFAARFDCVVIDGFGSTENAVIISRTPDTPVGALGQPFPDVKVLDPATSEECPAAVVDEHGQVTNLEQCVGELVNVTGTGQFAGYYQDEEATVARMRGGMYWSGDLAYRDADGFVYYAGRTADWLRVDGENLAAGPVERILLRHPAINQVSAYAVPDPHAGDRLVVALVLTASLTPQEFEEFLDAQEDLGTKARPFYVLIAESLPQTATNKVLKRDLRVGGLETSGTWWVREERGTTYSPLG